MLLKVSSHLNIVQSIQNYFKFFKKILYNFTRLFSFYWKHNIATTFLYISATCCSNISFGWATCFSNIFFFNSLYFLIGKSSFSFHNPNLYLIPFTVKMHTREKIAFPVSCSKTICSFNFFSLNFPNIFCV